MPLLPKLPRRRARGRPIESGVSIGIQDSLDELVERVAIERAAGYRRVKIKIKPGWDVDAVERVRERFGDIPLMVDANAAYTLDGRGAAGRARPVRPDDDRAAARLRRHPRPRAAAAADSRTPICLDESIHTVQAAAEAIELGACRIINIKPGRVGGHAESMRLHDLAAAHGIPVWHGGMLESGIGRAHNIHLSTLPNFTLPGDVAASRRYFAPDLIDPEIVVRPDGTIAVPDGPGHRRAHRDRPRRRGHRRKNGVARLTTDVWHQGAAIRTAIAVSLAVVTACVPPPPPKLPDAPQVPFPQKMAWIHQLEDQRLLRIDLPAPPPPPPPVKGKNPRRSSAHRPRPPLPTWRCSLVTVTLACAGGPRWRSGASSRRPACRYSSPG